MYLTGVYLNDLLRSVVKSKGLPDHYFPPQEYGHSPMPLMWIGSNKFANLWLVTVGEKTTTLSVFTTWPIDEEECPPSPPWEGKKEDCTSYAKEIWESGFVANIELDGSLELELGEHVHFYIDPGAVVFPQPEADVHM